MNKLCFLLRWTWYLSQSVQAISSSLFCWPWALSSPAVIIGPLLPLGVWILSAALTILLNVKRKRPRCRGFVSLLDVGYLQSLPLSVELEFPSDMRESMAHAVSSLYPKESRTASQTWHPQPSRSPQGHIAHHCFHPFPNIVSLPWDCEGSRESSSRCFQGERRACGGGERGQPFLAPYSCLWLCPQQTPV